MVVTADIRTAAEREAERKLPGDFSAVLAQYKLGFADGAVWAQQRLTPTREQIAEVLRGIGLSDLPDEYDSRIHSWRCEHPEIYGRCSCFDDAVNDLAALMAGLAEGEKDG